MLQNECLIGDNSNCRLRGEQRTIFLQITILTIYGILLLYLILVNRRFLQNYTIQTTNFTVFHGEYYSVLQNKYSKTDKKIKERGLPVRKMMYVILFADWKSALHLLSWI